MDKKYIGGQKPSAETPPKIDTKPSLLHTVAEKIFTIFRMMKNDKDIIYWKMNYKGKFKRTLCFIPIVIIMCFLTPLFMGAYWPVYDIFMIVVLIWAADLYISGNEV